MKDFEAVRLSLIQSWTKQGFSLVFLLSFLPSFCPSSCPSFSTVDLELEAMSLSPMSIKSTVGDSGHVLSPLWVSFVSILLSNWGRSVLDAELL